MPPQVKVGSVVKVTGIAGGTATVNATVLDIDPLGYSVSLNTDAYGCRLWHIDTAQVK